MWSVELVEIVRVLIDDMSDTPKYTNEHIQKLVLVAANQLIGDIEFTTSYVVDFSAKTLTPDPTESATLDSEFVNFVTIKAACVYGHASATAAARKTLILKDGGTQIDNTKQSDSLIKLLEKGYCAVYEQMKYERAIDSASQTGVAILGPIRQYIVKRIR